MGRWVGARKKSLLSFFCNFFVFVLGVGFGYGFVLGKKKGWVIGYGVRVRKCAGLGFFVVVGLDLY